MSAVRLRSTLAALFVLTLVGTACGTRIPEEELEVLLSAPAAGSDSTLGGPAVPGGSGSTVSPTGPGPQSGQTPGTPGRGGPVAQPGGPETCAENPGATDVGVTDSTIRVGASYAESSLVPGQFRPAIDAILAYVDLFNRSGGWCGRTIDFHAHNDELNAQRYDENVRHLVNEDQVFALLGNLSASDSGACGFLAGHKPPDGVPDIGTFALNYCRSQASNHYGPVGSLKQGIYGCCPDWDWLRDAFGYSHPAVHYLDIEISRDQGQAVVDALVRTLDLSGPGEVFQGEHSAAQFSYTGDVNSMRSDGVDGVWSSMDLNNNVKLLRAMCQQQWYPEVVHVEISAYDPALIERVGTECIERQNIWMRAFHLPFNQPNEELSLYIETLRSFCPGCEPTTFGLEGWLAAKLFVEMVKQIGPDLTRAKLYEALDGVRDWTGGGVMGPLTPSKRLIYHCNVLIHVRPDGFFMERGLECGKFYESGDYDGPPVGP